MSIKIRPRFTLRRKRAVWGYVFISPFIIGFIAFFLGPIVQSITFAFNELSIKAAGFELTYVGWENFRYALRVDPDFVRVFTETTVQILVELPAIILFSFFAATLLNQKFRGRWMARVIFFLPVILTAGIVYQFESGDILHDVLDYVADETGVFSVSQSMIGLLLILRMPASFTQYILAAVERVPDIINASAIPIVVFLSALQGIPSSLYECAAIEGATGWETFWKITFPLVSPLFLTNIIYIIVDSFTRPGNTLVELINDSAWGRGIYGVSVAMTWMYFGVIAVFLVLVFLLLAKRVVYMEE
ncbi:MAG TPA: sugar ABC transporter permease [Firmicutes bacterium]|nr:sugar ABC transporter permease [Bacillota bacterium]